MKNLFLVSVFVGILTVLVFGIFRNHAREPEKKLNEGTEVSESIKSAKKTSVKTQVIKGKTLWQPNH